MRASVWDDERSIDVIDSRAATEPETDHELSVLSGDTNVQTLSVLCAVRVEANLSTIEWNGLGNGQAVTIRDTYLSGTGPGGWRRSRNVARTWITRIGRNLQPGTPASDHLYGALPPSVLIDAVY
jgi:hypothetical protein